MPTQAYTKTVRDGYTQTHMTCSATGTNAYEASYIDDSGPPVSWEDTVNFGASLQGWRWLIAEGLNATTAMSGFRRKVLKNQWGWQEVRAYLNSNPSHRVKGGHYGLLFAPTVPASLASADAGDADRNAASEMWKKVFQAHTGFQSQILAGETPEALRMIRTRALSLFQGFRRYISGAKKRRRRRASGRERQRDVAKLWIEYQFGWAPLFSDIENAVGALQHPRSDRKFISAFSQHDSNPVVIEGETAAGPCIYKQSARFLRSYYVKYYGVVRMDPSYTASGALKHWGISTQEFLPTLWELMPWSFAIDYFTNLGEIVRARSYYSVRPQWVSKLIRQKRVGRYSAHGARLDPAFTSAWTVTDTTDQQSLFEIESSATLRVRKATLELPTLSFELPGPKQWLNLRALVELMNDSRRP